MLFQNGGNLRNLQGDQTLSQALKNIVIVGTKADLCTNLPIQQKSLVPFSQAKELCQRLGLSGCIETSSRYKSHKMFRNSQIALIQSPSYFDDLNDAFFMSACNCVDETTRQLLGEFNSVNGTIADGNLTANQSFLKMSMANKANMSFRGNQMRPILQNNPAMTRKQQSEEGIIQRAKVANENSLYSFKIQPNGHATRHGIPIRPGHNTSGEYDGMIHRRSFPRNFYDDTYDDLSDSSIGFNRNRCC